jgi:hypothetical protein
MRKMLTTVIPTDSLNHEQLQAFNHGYGPMAEDKLIAAYSLLAAANKVAYRADRGFTDRLSDSLKALAHMLLQFS